MKWNQTSGCFRVGCFFSLCNSGLYVTELRGSISGSYRVSQLPTELQEVVLSIISSKIHWHGRKFDSSRRDSAGGPDSVAIQRLGRVLQPNGPAKPHGIFHTWKKRWVFFFVCWPKWNFCPIVLWEMVTRRTALQRPPSLDLFIYLFNEKGDTEMLNVISCPIRRHDCWFPLKMMDSGQKISW